jgi:4-amino-4-deoxy-L-arabinose transferase and related glycosyltransferases of PMT family
MQTVSPSWAENFSAAASSRRRTRFLLPALLLLIYTGQCLWFIGTQSFTLDEPAHIKAGLAMWRYGKFVIQTDNPPLARKIATAPLYYFTNVDVDNMLPINALPIGLKPFHAWYVRLPFVLCGIILAVSLWLVTVRTFSESAATFVLALFAFSPGMIAHFSVAATDGLGVLTLFLAAIAFARWVNAPSWRNSAVLAVAVGVMLIAKFYGVPMAAVIVAVMLFESARKRDPRPLKQSVMVILVGYLIICLAYNLHVARFQFANGTVVAHFQHREHDWVQPVPFHNSFTLYIPGGDFIEGFVSVAQHSRGWHNAYLFGKTAPNGFPGYYHLCAIVLKWPTIVLILSALGGWALFRRKSALSRGAWLAALLPIIFFVLTIPTTLQIGDRHVLPIYPFLLICAAAGWHFFRQAKQVLLVLTLLALLNAVDVSRYAPDHLSYFTPVIRPASTWHYLADSNLDWGQGLIALRKYQDEHPGETIYMRSFGGFDPAFYGIRCQSFGENERPHGTVVVSANEMAGYLMDDANGMHWLLQHPLKAYLNHTLFVFQVD